MKNNLHSGRTMRMTLPQTCNELFTKLGTAFTEKFMDSKYYESWKSCVITSTLRYVEQTLNAKYETLISNLTGEDGAIQDDKIFEAIELYYRLKAVMAEISEGANQVRKLHITTPLIIWNMINPTTEPLEYPEEYMANAIEEANKRLAEMFEFEQHRKSIFEYASLNGSLLRGTLTEKSPAMLEFETTHLEDSVKMNRLLDYLHQIADDAIAWHCDREKYKYYDIQRTFKYKYLRSIKDTPEIFKYVLLEDDRYKLFKLIEPMLPHLVWKPNNDYKWELPRPFPPLIKTPAE